MVKKRRILGLAFSLLFLGVCWQIDLSASSGKLKTSSICTSGGITYGNHGDGHWHRATRHKSGWYPDGGNLGYTNPCTSSSGSSSPRTQSSSDTSSKTSVQPNKPERQAPKIEVATENVEKFFFELKKELTVDDLIDLFDVKALDSEDGDLSIHIITTDKEKIVVDNHDTKRNIVFKVMNSAGKIAEKKVTLQIKKREKPTLGQHDVVTYQKTPRCEEVLQKQKLFIIDSDGASRNLTCADIQVDAAHNQLIIRASDKYGLGNEFVVDYKLAPNNTSWVVNSFMYILIVGAGVFFYKRWRKKQE